MLHQAHMPCYHAKAPILPVLSPPRITLHSSPASRPRTFRYSTIPRPSLPRPESHSDPVIPEPILSERTVWRALQSRKNPMLEYFPTRESSSPLSSETFSNILNNLQEHPVHERTQRLERAVFDIPGGLARFNAEQNRTLFSKFRYLNAHDQVIEMIERSPDETFRTDPSHLLAYGEAHLQCRFFHPDKVIRLMESLSEKNPLDFKAHHILGLAYSRKAQIAKNLDKEWANFSLKSETLDKYLRCFDTAIRLGKDSASENYAANLKLSIEAFERAFRIKKTVKTALELIDLYLETKNPGKARKIALDVWRFYGPKAIDAKWKFSFARDVITFGLLSHASKSDLSSWIRVLLKSKHTETQLKEVLENLDSIKEHCPSHTFAYVRNILESAIK